MYRQLSRALAVAGVASILLTGCTVVRQAASRYPAADISSIYAQALPNPDRNPVILVHGFGGARLEREVDGAAVWGSFFTGDSLLPSKPEGLRAFALDIDHLERPIEPAGLVSIEDDTHAVELLEQVEADAKVANINVNVYAALVKMAEQAGYRECGSPGVEDESIVNPACFTFFYDWRQDNVGNAIAFGDFLTKARKQIEGERKRLGTESDRPVKFDVIAHSMGGLVTRYFLRYGAKDVLAETSPRIDWAGAENIYRLILISTPNFGSMKVLKEMITGQRYPVVKFEPAMFATWLSLYQMLPREHHDVWRNSGGHPRSFEFMSADFWLQNRWGPFAPGQDKFLEILMPNLTSPQARAGLLAEFMDAAFERARRFHAALDRPPDSKPSTKLILFAADAQPTLGRAVVISDQNSTRLKFDVKGVPLKEPGDGSVTRASTVADERQVDNARGWLSSPVSWDQQVFLTDIHRTLLGNPTFQNNLLHLLLETPPEI